MFRYKEVFVAWSQEEFIYIQDDVNIMLKTLKHWEFTLSAEQQLFANKIKIKKENEDAKINDEFDGIFYSRLKIKIGSPFFKQIIHKNKVYYEYNSETGVLSLHGDQNKVNKTIKYLQSYQPFTINIDISSMYVFNMKCVKLWKYKNSNQSFRKPSRMYRIYTKQILLVFDILH